MRKGVRMSQPFRSTEWILGRGWIRLMFAALRSCILSLPLDTLSVHWLSVLVLYLKQGGNCLQWEAVPASTAYITVNPLHPSTSLATRRDKQLGSHLQSMKLPTVSNSMRATRLSRLWLKSWRRRTLDQSNTLLMRRNATRTLALAIRHRKQASTALYVYYNALELF